MIAIPLLFFLFFFLHVYQKNGFDVAAFIIGLYVITSFFGLILFNQDYEYLYGNYSEFEVSLIPALIYCLMIGICITPVVSYNSNKNRKISVIKNKKMFNFITNIYFAVFVALIVIFAEDILFRLLFGDLGELRDMQYAGELLNAQDKFSGPLRFVSTIFTLLGDGAYFMLVFFFYSLSALDNSNIKNISILISSLSPVVLGIVNIDRSKATFWIILFIMSFIMFRPYIPEGKRHFFRRITIVVMVALLLYLGSVTISRFGDMEGGTSGGLLSYIGQPFINFCEIWNKVYDQNIHTQRLFPLTNFLLGNDTSALIDEIMSMYYKTGVHLNVFFSFVGMFLVDFGHLGAIFIPLMIFFLSQSVINKIRYNNVADLHSFIVLFSVSAILSCGIITYFYSTMPRVVSLILFLILSKKIK